MRTASSQIRGPGEVARFADWVWHPRPCPAGPISDQDNELSRIMRALVLALLAVRAVHLSQGYLDLVSGWYAYQCPVLAAVVAAGCSVETLWLATWSWRRGRLDAVALMVEVAWGVVALLVLSGALRGGDRTTSLNWILPYTVGTAVAGGLALRAHLALLQASVLSVVYMASVWPVVTQGRGPATTALVNALSYLGFCFVAVILRAVLLRLADLLRQARCESVVRGEQLAAERERTRQHVLIHDSALQTLEAVAKGWGEGNSTLRRRAQQESQRLRLALREGQHPALDGGLDLRTRIGLLITEFAGRGLNVEYVSAELVTTPPAPVTDALCGATREALTNIVKHAVTDTAVIRVATADHGVEVTIRDRGRGFEPAIGGAGFGLTYSIRDRIARVGGHAEIRSAPGAGTLVCLWSVP